MNSVLYVTNYVTIYNNQINDYRTSVYHGSFGGYPWHLQKTWRTPSIALEELENLYPGHLFGGIFPIHDDHNTRLRLLGNSLRIRDRLTTTADLFKVRVYKNLHRKTFSLLKYGLVIGYSNHLIMRNVKVVINKSGRDRAIKTKQRNVHAFLEGDCYTSPSVIECSNLPREIKYSPERGFTVDGETRTHFECVRLKHGQAFEIKLN